MAYDKGNQVSRVFIRFTQGGSKNLTQLHNYNSRAERVEVGATVMTKKLPGTVKQHSYRAARNAGRQFMMWMPTMPMTLVSAKSATVVNPAYATFRVPPRMTKHEIKEYLTKIYSLPVRKVNTMNYDGKRKRIMSRAGIAYFKYKDFKKAVIYFDESFRDVGIGTRIPEMEGYDDDENDVIDVMDANVAGSNIEQQKQIGG